MSYATVAQIESEFKGIDFTSTSAITITEVEVFLTETDQLINIRLANRYVTPITEVNSLLIVRKIEIDFVAYRVANILNLKKAIPLPEKNIVQELNKGSAYRESQKLLNDIFNGIVNLPDQPVLNSREGIRSYTFENSIEPVFEKGVDQW